VGNGLNCLYSIVGQFSFFCLHPAHQKKGDSGNKNKEKVNFFVGRFKARGKLKALQGTLSAGQSNRMIINFHIASYCGAFFLLFKLSHSLTLSFLLALIFFLSSLALEWRKNKKLEVFIIFSHFVVP
jgi:hypothetical protein